VLRIISLKTTNIFLIIGRFTLANHLTPRQRGETSHYPLREVDRWAVPLFTARLTVMWLTPQCSAIASMLYMPVPYASASARSLSLQDIKEDLAVIIRNPKKDRPALLIARGYMVQRTRELDSQRPGQRSPSQKGVQCET
jgi:hypothetical protein